MHYWRKHKKYNDIKMNWQYMISLGPTFCHGMQNFHPNNVIFIFRRNRLSHKTFKMHTEYVSFQFSVNTIFCKQFQYEIHSAGRTLQDLAMENCGS